MNRPDRLYRLLALAEMVTWTLLLLGMLGKYVVGWPLATTIGGGVHGFVFLSYCVVTVLVAIDQRWRLRDLVMGLGSAVIPYATVPFERSAERRGLLGERWRLLTEAPRGPIETPTALALRRPLGAAALALVAVTAVFFGLLQAGPPTEWVN